VRWMNSLQNRLSGSASKPRNPPLPRRITIQNWRSVFC